MCGIIGYIGKRKATEVIMNGLKRVEYRGYDSAGISIIENGKLVTIKKSGRLNELNKLIDHNKYSSNIGFGHTRWATHGEPNDINAHPHLDNSGKVSIIHNGIIENYSALKSLLTKQGYHFKTETDTEVLAVYIGSIYEKKQKYC